MTNDSQKTRILRYLKRGGKLTVLKALKMFDVFALSQRVTDLRRAGHKIKRDWVTLRNGKRIKRYSL